MFTMRHSLFALLCLMAGMSLTYQQPAAMADETSYASEIVKDVREDKVYLLEKIRRELTKPSEKILVEALLTKDGPKAATLYQKQLEEYPDPQLDPISRSRLLAYEQAAATTPGLPVMQTRALSDSKPSVATATPAQTTIPTAIPDPPKRVPPPVAPLASTGNAAPRPAPTAPGMVPAAPAPIAPAMTSGGTGRFTLQFGSFDSITNADLMVAQLHASAPATVKQINSVYKVRLKRSFATEEEAEAFARQLPIETIVVPQQP
jgi:cell division protein FtsN